jgi:hypothetical protein
MRHGYIWARAVLVVVGISGCVAGGDAASGEQASETQQAVTSVDVWHSNWNGGSADLTQYTGTSLVQLNAFESKTAKTRNVGFNVYAYAYDPNSQVCNNETICWDPTDPTTCYTYTWCYYAGYTVTQGYGQIGNKDFAVGGKTAALRTDLAADPNFYGQTCTATASSFTCGPATGTVNVVWKANGYYSKGQNGTTDFSYSYGGSTYTSRTTGQYSSTSANVSGTVLGSDVTGAAGEISDSKGNTVSKQVFKN